MQRMRRPMPMGTSTVKLGVPFGMADHSRLGAMRVTEHREARTSARGGLQGNEPYTRCVCKTSGTLRRSIISATRSGALGIELAS